MRQLTFLAMIFRVILLQRESWVNPRTDLLDNVEIWFDQRRPINSANFGLIAARPSSLRSNATAIARLHSVPSRRNFN